MTQNTPANPQRGSVSAEERGGGDTFPKAGRPWGQHGRGQTCREAGDETDRVTFSWGGRKTGVLGAAWRVGRQ